MSAETKPVEFQHEYVTDSTFSTRCARAFTGFLFTRPRGVIRLVAAALIGGVAILYGLVLESSALIVSGLIYSSLIPILALVVFVSTKRSHARRLPIGSRIAIGLGDATIRCETLMGSSDVSYRAYSSVQRSRDFVVLTHRGMKLYSLFPIELFPGADFEKLRNAIARADA